MKKKWLLIELAGLCLLIGFYFLRPVPLSNRILDTAVSMVLSDIDAAISPEKFISQGSHPIILDVRTKEEYDVSHLPEAIHVGETGEYLPDGLQYTDDLLVYCSIGKRSEELMKVLQSDGYQKVQNLYGGIFAWAEAGLPLESDRTSEEHFVHGYSAFWARLTTFPRVYLDSK